MENKRKCIGVGCGRVLQGCFGFVLARDVVAYIEGRRAETPRELCGRCSEGQNWPDSLEIPKWN